MLSWSNTWLTGSNPWLRLYWTSTAAFWSPTHCLKSGGILSPMKRSHKACLFTDTRVLMSPHALYGCTFRDGCHSSGELCFSVSKAAHQTPSTSKVQAFIWDDTLLLTCGLYTMKKWNNKLYLKWIKSLVSGLCLLFTFFASANTIW